MLNGLIFVGENQGHTTKQNYIELFSMVGLVAKQQRIYWKYIMYLSVTLWFSEFFQTVDLEKSFQEVKSHYASQKTQTKYGEKFMKGLNFTLLCISVWTPWVWEGSKMYTLQANVPSLLQWIMMWKSFASLCAGKFAVVESRLSGRAFGFIYCPFLEMSFFTTNLSYSAAKEPGIPVNKNCVLITWMCFNLSICMRA